MIDKSRKTNSLALVPRRQRTRAQSGSAQELVPSISEQEQHAEACIGFFKEQLRAQDRDEKTISCYVADIRIFRESLGKDILEVQRTDIYHVVELWQQRGVAESTIRRRAAALRRVYDLLFNAGLISIRPTANLRLPKAWKRVPRAALPEDLERVIAAVGLVSPFDLRDRALLLLLRDTGPRATAVCFSELSDVDWKQSRLLLRHDKFGKQHWIPLSNRSLEALRTYVETARPSFLRGRELPYLFPSRHSVGPLNRARLWQITTFWTEKVLGARYSPHSWRHTCLTEGAEKDMDLFDLMVMAGHSSPETTRIYIEHSIRDLKKTFQQAHPRAAKVSK